MEDDDDAIARGMSATDALVSLAREDSATFVGFVLRDEATGKPIEMAPCHIAWHQLADTHKRLIILAHPELGKTSQLTVGRTLWALAKNPSARVAIVSNTYTQAEKIIRIIGRYITQSAELKLVAPTLKPVDPWTSTQLFVARPHPGKDPSAAAYGIHGNVLGARIDLLIMDDCNDYENTRTPAMRDDIYAWFQSTLVGRLTKDASVICVGTAFHEQDLLHRLAHQWGPGCAYKYPVVDEEGNPRWPERWPLERIATRKTELSPLEFARQMLCAPRDDATSKFKREWIQVALNRGNGKSMNFYALSSVPNGCRTITGVDLAVAQHSAADLTAIFTILVYPDKSREVLCIESGRWSGPEIIERIFQTHVRFKSEVIVESNAAQDFIVQFAGSKYAIPIKGVVTGRNKAHPEFGVEAIAAEMASGKWIIPNDGGRCHPEVQAWIDEMLSYDPRSHTGDRLMASYFCDQEVNKVQPKSETGRLNFSMR